MNIEIDFQTEARQALASKAKIVLITGGAGMGKTHLVREHAADDVAIIDNLDDCTWEHFEAVTQDARRVLCTLNTRLNQSRVHDRIKTKVCQGAIVHMEAPNEYARTKIARQFGIDPRFINIVGGRVRTFPALVGCCIAMNAVNPEDLEAANKVINNYSDKLYGLTSRNRPSHVFRTVLDVVKDVYMVQEHEVTGQRRVKALMWPRHVAIYAVKELSRLTLSEIGNYFGGRDHSTILHSINKIKSKVHWKDEGDKFVEMCKARLDERVEATV